MPLACSKTFSSCCGCHRLIFKPSFYPQLCAAGTGTLQTASLLARWRQVRLGQERALEGDWTAEEGKGFLLSASCFCQCHHSNPSSPAPAVPLVPFIPVSPLDISLQFFPTRRTSLIVTPLETPAPAGHCPLLRCPGPRATGPFLWTQRHQPSVVRVLILQGPLPNF